MTRIDRSFDTAVGRLDANSGMTSARAGSLAGDAVQLVKDPLSLLDSMKEEMGMHMSERIEKELDDREIGGEVPAHRMEIEEIEKYLDASHSFTDPRRLAEIIKLLQANPRDAAALGYPPAHRYVLLQRALHEAAQNGRPTESLQEEIDVLQHENGPRIRIALNSVVAAGEFRTTAQGVVDFQNAAADVVLGEATLAATLTLVLKRLAGGSGEDFERGMKALLAALGDDLRSTHPSTNPHRLQALIQDLYHLEVAGTVIEECRRLATTFASRFEGQAIDPMVLMQELVMLTAERWVMPARLHKLAAQFAAEKLIAMRIAFYSGTRGALRKMPVKVFVDSESRMALLDTAQTVLDEAIRQEEEECGG